ncbi:type-F conjugative transfer system secretin TraK [Erwinia tasmaniensis]|uniref:TraK protein n=1 Tax=Erwinia tasmaniensis (strain DSM 17950 / CFBP 7177 / CIP 109463 / NCPPB 4357 / Et1/99) TaxID=465817 RepID=B2VB08_ERWT9|nr:type-F conjugative transfer system secretin TraK [Erwinia tasmaniensis]CAO94956.1 TraK protein [Erwinia tasmaniensis Et1/99]
MINKKYFLSPALLIAAAFQTHAAVVPGVKEISFGPNAQVNAAFSQVSPNRIIVQGEKITDISGPGGAFDSQKQPDGGALISLAPGVSQSFTLFVVTDKNSALSIEIIPKSIPGKTLSFVPQTAPMKVKPEEKSWEEGQSYEKTLVDISKSIINGVIPQDFSEYPVSRVQAYSPAVGVTLRADKHFIGPHMRIVRYIMNNPSYLNQDLTEKQFYAPGVRAVMLSTRNLYSHGEGYAYVIFDDAQGGAHG